MERLGLILAVVTGRKQISITFSIFIFLSTCFLNCSTTANNWERRNCASRFVLTSNFNLICRLFFIFDFMAPLAKLSNLELQSLLNFFLTLKNLEKQTCKGCEYSNHQEINFFLHQHFDNVVSSIKTKEQKKEGGENDDKNLIKNACEKNLTKKGPPTFLKQAVLLE